MEKTYMHTGIPVKEKMEGMVYMDAFQVWICNNTDWNIEYLYWEKDSTAPCRMVKESHVAYKVADVDAAVKESGGKVLWPKMSLGGTAAISFVSIKGGPVVEFYQD